MLAGKLKYRFAFDKRTEPVDDGFGNVVNGWAEQFKIWVGKKYIIGGGEKILAARLTGNQPVVITVRCSSLTDQITTDWRCRDLRSGETFNIRTITSADVREGYKDLLVESGVAEG